MSVFNKKCINITPYFYEKNSNNNNNNTNIKLEDFNILKCIGLGGFSRVYLV